MTLGGISTVKPELETPFPSQERYWEYNSPGGLIRVPTGEDENRKWRETLLHKAQNDSVLQQELKAACKASPVFFADTFVWTLWEQEVDVVTHSTVPAKTALHPWICWPRQREALQFIWDCFEKGQDALIDKSRDLGMSWLCMIFCDWLWLFRPNTQIRCMSRTEDLVDSPISKSLFYKLDTVHSWLPEWLCPPGVLVRGRENRTSLRIHNALNGSTIAGESTN